MCDSEEELPATQPIQSYGGENTEVDDSGEELPATQLYSNPILNDVEEEQLHDTQPYPPVYGTEPNVATCGESDAEGCDDEVVWEQRFSGELPTHLDVYGTSNPSHNGFVMYFAGM